MLIEYMLRKEILSRMLTEVVITSAFKILYLGYDVLHLASSLLSHFSFGLPSWRWTSSWSSSIYFSFYDQLSFMPPISWQCVQSILNNAGWRKWIVWFWFAVVSELIRWCGVLSMEFKAFFCSTTFLERQFCDGLECSLSASLLHNSLNFLKSWVW